MLRCIVIYNASRSPLLYDRGFKSRRDSKSRQLDEISSSCFCLSAQHMRTMGPSISAVLHEHLSRCEKSVQLPVEITPTLRAKLKFLGFPFMIVST
jgi:hypothetical protein